MQTMAIIYFPLLRKCERPKFNILEIVKSLGHALEFYRGALSMTYLTALDFGRRNECPHEEDLEGRDPRW